MEDFLRPESLGKQMSDKIYFEKTAEPDCRLKRPKLDRRSRFFAEG
jgi:hypothetical protein